MQPHSTNNSEANKDYWDDNYFNYRFMKHWSKWGKKNTTLEDLWTRNTLANLETIKDYPGVWKLPSCEEKAVIIVGASPNIREDCRYLKDLPPHYVTICTNSALKLLLNNDIIPNYVIAVDSQPVLKEHLDVGEESRSIPLIACNSLDPSIFATWKGPVYIAPYLAIKDKEAKKIIRKIHGREAPSGGNAFNNAAALAAYALKTSVIVFMGNELSWKGKNYYADKPSFNDGSLVFPAVGVDGRRTYTNTVLYQYKIWLEAFCQQNSHIVFYNCSRGILGYSEMTGYTDNIYHMDAPKAFEEIDRGMAQFNDLNERERIKYNIGYASNYHPIGGGEFWKALLSASKDLVFRRGLDIGCGPGYGVKHAREKGYDVYGIDIADSLAPVWEENGLSDYIQPCPADKMPFQDYTFDFITCVEVMEHLPEEKVAAVLAEIKRVSCGIILFSIAKRTVTDSGGDLLDNKYEPHLTIKPWKWWKKQIEDAGLVIRYKNEVFKKGSIFVQCDPGGPFGSKIYVIAKTLWDDDAAGN